MRPAPLATKRFTMIKTMKNMIKTFLLVICLVAFSACTKEEEPTPEVVSKKETVEVILKFGPTFANYALYLGLQGTSVDSDLSSDFDFVGIETAKDGAIIHGASVIKTASYPQIPSSEIRFKTSQPVSTLSVAIVAPSPVLIETTVPTLDYKVEFYINGLLVGTKTQNPFPIDPAGKVYVLVVADPSNIIVGDNNTI